MIIIFVEVEIRCPVQCKHCSTNAIPVNASIKLPDLKDLFEKVYEFVHFLIEQNQEVSVNLFGGEPLLVDVDEIISFLSELKKIGVKKFWIPTSLIIPQQNLEKLGLLSQYATITTSFDPVIRFRTKDQIKRWLNAYFSCAKQGIRPSVEFVLTPYLLEFPLFEFLDAIGYKFFEIGPLIPTGRALTKKDQLWVPLKTAAEFFSHIAAVSEGFRKSYVKTLKASLGISSCTEKPIVNSCYGACWDKFYIGRDGTVLSGEKCISLTLGNIFKNTPEEIVFSTNRFLFIELKTQITECQKCEYFAFCLGECPTVHQFRQKYDKSGECYGLKSFLRDVENWNFRENHKKFPMKPISKEMIKFMNELYSAIDEVEAK